MRTRTDRIRHAISFEIFGLLLVTPLTALIFGHAILDIGLVTIVGMCIGAVWNYIFNILFDRTLVRIRGAVHKSVSVRVVHAVLFEIGFLFVSVPFVAWYLEITILIAFFLDVAISAFFLIYAFGFNWTYDWAYPIKSVPD